MRRLLAVLLLLLPMSAFATAVSWDGNTTTKILQPLQSLRLATVKGNNFTATSTTATSTFPILNAVTRFFGAGLTNCVGAGEALTWDSSTWQFGCTTISGGGTPGGADTQVQFNNAGAFGGDSLFAWDNTNKILNVLNIRAFNSNNLNLVGRPDTVYSELSLGENILLDFDGSTAVDTAGGSITIQSQAGNGTGNGGSITQTAGLGGGTGVGGGIVQTAGNGGGTSGSGGSFLFTAGSAGASGDGGQISFDPGNAIGAGTIGGSFNFNSGGANGKADDGAGNIFGASFFQFGGGSSDSNRGGNVSINAGPIIAGVGTGGSVTLNSGNGGGANPGGAFTIQSGAGGDGGAGGAVSMLAGNGGATSGFGGSITLNAGAATAANSDGGQIILNGGASTGSGISGEVTITAGAGDTVGSDTGGIASLVGGAGTTGGISKIIGGAGNGTGGGAQVIGGLGGTWGGTVTITGGQGLSTSGGGPVNITGGTGSSGTDGGSVTITGGQSSGFGGDLTLRAGIGSTPGNIYLYQGTGKKAILDTTSLASTDKTFTFPNASGTFCLTSTCTGTVTNIATTFPISGGPITTTGTLSWIGLATTSQPTAGQMLYSNGTNGLTPVSTSTVTCSSGVSCGSTSYVLNGALSITNTGVTSIVAGDAISISGATGAVTISETDKYRISTSSLAIGNLAYITGTSPTAIQGVATGTISSANSALTVTGSRYAVGGAAVFTISTTTTTMFTGTAGQVLAFTNTGWTGVATTTFSTGLTYSAASNAVTVNTSQNIATLSNLTTNGLVTTSGSNGTLGVTANGTAGFILAMSGGVPTYVATTTFSSGLAYSGGNVTNTGVLSVGVTGSALTGAVLFATSSTAYQGLTASTTITCVTQTCTFANTMAGILGPIGGGTGLSSYTTGDILYASNTNVLSKLSAGSNGTVLAVSGGIPAWVATTTFSGTAPITTSFSGGVVTVACPTCATGGNPGGSNTQLQFNDSAVFGGASATAYDKNYGALGLGTTTPKWMLTIASSTRPQLTLTDASLTSNQYSFRTINGWFYLSTTSPTTFATSSIALLTIDNVGNFGIGSTTPWAQFSLASTTYSGGSPLLSISTSTDLWGNILHVFATTSTQIGSVIGGDSGARFAIGTTTVHGFPNLDQFFVNGRQNSSWRSLFCDTFGQTSATLAQLVADTPNICNQYYLVEDTAGVYDLVAQVGGGDIYGRLRTGTAGTASAASDGIGIAYPTAFLTTATSTPVMEITARKAVMANASSSIAILGFANYTGVSPDYATLPTDGCYFEASSTAANWWLVSSAASTRTYVDTTIASSTSVTSTGKFQKFRIELSTGNCIGYIANGNVDYIKKVSTTNVPTAVLLNPVATIADFTTAGLAKELHVRTMRVWYRGVDDMTADGL